MSFGSVLHRNRSQWLQFIERLIYRLLGWPNILRRLQWPHLFSMLAANEKTIILDLGAGSMQYSAEVAKQTGAHVVAVDLVIPEGCAVWAGENRISVIKSDAMRLPFSDSSIDRIIMSSLLQAVPDPILLLNECRRVLKRDGFIVLTVPNHYKYISKVFDCFSMVALRKILSLPRSYAEFINILNAQFHVSGPCGYYSLGELSAMIEKARFQVAWHRYSPSGLGAVLWEIGILLYLRFGRTPIYVFFLFYPLARLVDSMKKSTDGCEHVLKAEPVER
jgi:ubiquinone/menaquinone biosynthesis C-methylase UbiE